MFSFASTLFIQTTPGALRPSSGGMSFVSAYGLPFTRSPSFRMIFGSSSGINGDAPEAMRDTQGPTMQERMDLERQERMRTTTGN